MSGHTPIPDMVEDEYLGDEEVSPVSEVVNTHAEESVAVQSVDEKEVGPVDPQLEEYLSEEFVERDAIQAGEAINTPPSHPSALLADHPDLTSHPADDLHRPESPTTSLISSLRQQLHLLSEQSNQLNTKLVTSITKHADFEDSHEALKTRHRELEVRAEGLEVDKRKWEDSMNAGLLLEGSQVREEMQRLAQGLVDEERRRGSAEEGRRKVEDEVDELAASLFDQANTMVAAERMSRIQAETRLKSTEDNLAAAESAVRDMQLHLQSLPTASTSHQRSLSTPPIPRRYLSSHLPYTEYQTFLQHLRSLRPLREHSKALFPPPFVANLLAQAFLARAITEDHDATLRLDASPELSWLSRRSVSSAVIAGDLIIEPVSASTVINSSTMPITDIGCSLCGKPVFPNATPSSPTTQFGPPPTHPSAHRTSSGGRFSLKPFFNNNTPNTTSSPGSPIQSPLASPAHGSTSQQRPVYIFRIAKPSSEKEAKAYPLCKTGWCLERLRATCELWHFVRNGVVLPVWHGDDGFHVIGEEVHTPNTRDVRVGSTDMSIGEGGVPRKSGWGLGFKLGDKGSNGWTRGWSSGGSNKGNSSPPVSPGLTGEQKLEEEVIVLDEKEKQQGGGETASGLGAPLELDGTEEEKHADGTRLSHESVPAIQEIASSPVNNPTPAQTDSSALLPTPLRVGSPTSLSTSADDEDDTGFHTPKVDGSPEIGANGSGEVSSHVVELRSPVIASRNGSSDVLSPPPIPKRAVARESLRSIATNKVEPESTGGEGEIQPVNLDEQGSKRQSGPPLPPLPARHPRTPVAQVHEGLAIDGEKSFVSGDSWEAKTWRQVVKLKEEMWKSRLGVVDAELDH